MNNTPSTEKKDRRPPRPLPPSAVGETDRLWDEIQSLWDEQSRRIDHALAAAERSETQQNAPLPATPCRVRLLRRHLVLLAVFLAAAIYWGSLIPSLAYTVPALIVCAAIEGAYLLLAFECLRQVRGLAGSDPARATLDAAAQHTLPQESHYALTAISIAAVTILTVTACTPTGGNSYAMVCDQPSHAAVIETIASSIAAI